MDAGAVSGGTRTSSGTFFSGCPFAWCRGMSSSDMDFDPWSLFPWQVSERRWLQHSDLLSPQRKDQRHTEDQSPSKAQVTYSCSQRMTLTFKTILPETGRTGEQASTGGGPKNPMHPLNEGESWESCWTSDVFAGPESTRLLLGKAPQISFGGPAFFHARF